MKRPAPFAPLAIPSVTTAAHFLTDAGSSIARARDLLSLGGWQDRHTAARLSAALALVNGVRLVVDAHLAVAIAHELGEPQPSHVAGELELGLAMLSE